MKARWLSAALLCLAACGRYFPGPVTPRPEADQSGGVTVSDDGTVSHAIERLEISLCPVSDAELNRALPTESARGAASTNPYTYGNWTPAGDTWTPPRFAVFLLKVKNYAFPKVRVDPGSISLHSESGRVYRALSFLQFNEYYRAHALAWAGNAHARYRERVDLLRRTLYAGRMVFSGQEDEGYVVFPALPPDVTRFHIALAGVSLRFNYAGEPVESVDLTYRFEREVHKGFQPPAQITVR